MSKSMPITYIAYVALFILLDCQPFFEMVETPTKGDGIGLTPGATSRLGTRGKNSAWWVAISPWIRHLALCHSPSILNPSRMTI